MRLFRRQYQPGEFGALLYETVRAAIAAPSGELSFVQLLKNLDWTFDRLPPQHVGEVVIGSLFAATLAIDRSVPRWISGDITGGMCAEFRVHLGEQGASHEQVAEWAQVLMTRFAELHQELEGYDGLEPPWKLGRRFLWNILGEEEKSALRIKHATLFLLAARDRAQQLLNTYGPDINTLPAT
jgi:hypothetical protein